VDGDTSQKLEIPSDVLSTQHRRRRAFMEDAAKRGITLDEGQANHHAHVFDAIMALANVHYLHITPNFYAGLGFHTRASCMKR
jgi:hypothetical protein